jgi:hypothetical protein
VIIFKIEGRDLSGLCAALNNHPNIYSLRVGIDGFDLKVKINGGMWWAPIGEIEAASVGVDLAVE